MDGCYVYPFLFGFADPGDWHGASFASFSFFISLLLLVVAHKEHSMVNDGKSFRLADFETSYRPSHSGVASSLPPSGCRVTFVKGLIRYGSRYPGKDNNDQWKLVIRKIKTRAQHFPDRYSFLRTYRHALVDDSMTPRGKEETISAGAGFCRRYRALAVEAFPSLVDLLALMELCRFVTAASMPYIKAEFRHLFTPQEWRQFLHGLALKKYYYTGNMAAVPNRHAAVTDLVAKLQALPGRSRLHVELTNLGSVKLFRLSPLSLPIPLTIEPAAHLSAQIPPPNRPPLAAVRRHGAAMGRAHAASRAATGHHCSGVLQPWLRRPSLR